MISKQLIQFIKDKAESVPQIKQVIFHPDGNDIIEIVNNEVKVKGQRLKKYPGMIFSKVGFENTFSDTGSNFIVDEYVGWVLVPLDNIENVNVFEEVMPDAVDAVLKKFAEDWNGGTYEGHRIWVRVSSGRQGYTPEDSGRLAWTEITIIIKYSVDI